MLYVPIRKSYIKTFKSIMMISILLNCILDMVWTPAFAVQASALRGKRFCEVIISTSASVLEIYNTISLNDCPEEQWKKITERNIQKETGATYVVLNGPRKLSVDGAKNAEFMNNAPRTFQNLAMRKSAALHISIRETLHGSRPYHEHHVERQTTWVISAGSRVYELIDPAGAVYVMQSFTLIPGTLTEKDLLNLSARLKLPRGWHFKTGILQKECDLAPIQKKAIVIQDNLKNTYQKTNQDFLV